MIKLLLRMATKGDSDMKLPASRLAVGKLAGITGIICNSLLFLFKLIVGLLSGAVSIVADAMNNLSDAASSVVTLLGFRLAQRPADADHPYGHARYEYLSGLIVAALILVIGVELAQSSVRKIFYPDSVTFSMLTFVVLICSVLLKLWMCGFFAILGRKIDSTTLKAASMDCRNDVIASAAVLAGCAVQHFFHTNVDGYVGLAVALFILYSGIGLAKETISPLLGQRADAALVEQIGSLVMSHEKVLGIHDLLVHDYGPGRCFASAHLELSAEEDVLVCHDIIDTIECEVLERLNVHMVIHYDPVTQNDEEWEHMRQVVTQIISEIDPRLSLHDFRIARGKDQSRLKFDLVMPYAMGTEPGELKCRIDRALAEKNMQYTTVIRFDEHG